MVSLILPTNFHPNPPLYDAKWQTDLGISLEDKDCLQIWETTKSCCPSTLAQETNYKGSVPIILGPSNSSQKPPTIPTYMLQGLQCIGDFQAYLANLPGRPIILAQMLQNALPNI